jgi:hypothetical protein
LLAGKTRLARGSTSPVDSTTLLPHASTGCRRRLGRSGSIAGGGSGSDNRLKGGRRD